MVSDRDSHEKNPYDEFTEAIRRFLNLSGHSSAGLHVDVGDTEEGEYGRRKVRLALPPKDEMDRFVTAELGEFLARIAGNPNTDDSFRYNKKDIRFSIRYNGSEKRFAGGGHLSYTAPYSIRNPLTNGLISKGAQLAKSGYHGTKSIVICDGGCDALNERSRVNGAYGCQELAEGYLRAHPYILWVLVLRIEEKHTAFPRKSAIAVRPKLYWNPQRDKSLFRDTVTALGRVVMHLPAPEATPSNALNWLNGRTAHVGRSLGGYSMKKNAIKISARALAELLAGRVTAQKFLEGHCFKPNPLEPNSFSFNFFENQILRGNTIQNAFVEKDPQKDDDWIVLEYDGPDPAISPFRCPD